MYCYLIWYFYFFNNFFVFFLLFRLWIIFFSLSLALLTEARLLCLISISSTLSALETVNLKSLLSIGVLSFSLLFPVGLSSFFMKAFVACCSINFLLNFLFLCSVFLNPGLESNGFLLPFDCLKEVFLSFEIEKVFLLSLFLKELESILFLKFEDIVNVFFCLCYYPYII